MRTKYLGKLFDGRWEVVDRKEHIFILKNIYNQETMEIRENVFYNLLDGKTTISNIRTCRIYGESDNEIIKKPKVIKRRDYQAYRRLQEKRS